MSDETPKVDDNITVGTKFEQGKAVQSITYTVPADQAWLKYLLERQTMVLDSINGKLTFFVVITVISLVLGLLSVLRACAGV